MKIIARLMCVLVLAMAVAALPAMADSISGSLTVANANLATQGAGPYASYTLMGVGAGSTFTNFTITLTGMNNFVFGDHNILSLNIAPGAGAITNVSCSFAGCATGSGNVDGFGTFSLTVDDGSGFSAPGPYSSITVSFTVATATTAGSLLATNGNGASIAAHMALATNTACTGFAANGGSSTGTVDNTACTSGQPPPGVPEPASLILFGTGLSGLGLFARRKLSQ